jgi:glutamate dehydrogenase/leucine dehydrogenase
MLVSSPFTLDRKSIPIEKKKLIHSQGYGHIAREAARLFQAHGVEVIAANTKGEKSEDTGVRLISSLQSEDKQLITVVYRTWDRR